ncbi:MAG: hypothetical protein BGO57_01180 [Sphingomonadales bacterium 63-6]|nr:MAG: hypothetical protein BGO57_01180 [Sphingomonadales bacterium 63-6]
MQIGLRAVLTLAVICAAQPAYSQGFSGAIMAGLPDVLGQIAGRAANGRMRCEVFVDKDEQFEAHAPGTKLMSDYFAAASAGKPRSALFKLTKKTRWTSGDAVADQTNLDRQIDPLAVAGNTLEPLPLRFYRAGSFTTAHGQWAVHAPDGSIAGVYDGFLEREGKVWKFRTLTLLRPEDEVVPANPYCQKPGDTDEADVNAFKMGVERTEKQLVKRKAKFAAADEKARAAEAKAAGKKGSAATAAGTLRAAAEEAAKKVAESEKNLAELQESLTKAETKLADYRALTGPARNAENFRETYDMTVND